jgi:ssDNA-specific exonuclease RecJ
MCSVFLEDDSELANHVNERFDHADVFGNLSSSYDSDENLFDENGFHRIYFIFYQREIEGNK